jgi:diacylglycerol kinase
MSKFHSVPRSFGYAWSGLITAWQKEPNFRVHLLIAAIALVMGFLLGISHIEWVVLTFVIAWVLVLELVNTSIEAIVNMVSPEIRPEAKIAKDTASAAVFLSALGAVIVGLILFVPKII